MRLRQRATTGATYRVRGAAGGPTRHNQRQTCGTVLKNDDIEFDHIIPLAKGGSSEEHNVRVACFDCNRSKSDAYET